MRNGISCTIDAVEITPLDDYSLITCTITLENHDGVNYYILDPAKMGDLHFNYFTGGVTFKNTETKVRYPLRWSVPYAEWDNIAMDYFSLLEKNSRVTLTFQSSDYHRMETGSYSASFRFCGTKHHTPEFNLNQTGGRIWVGNIHSAIDDVIVE